MKKIITFIMSAMIVLSISSTVLAGEYDVNEQYIIEQMESDTFPVKIEQRYINQLQNYFCKEDVRLSKAEADDFLNYLKKGLTEKEKLGNKKKSLDEFSSVYQKFQEAGQIIGLYLEYDSAVNGFYAIDQAGYIVLDSQPVIKNTDSIKDDLPIEGIGTAIIFVCIIVFLLNLRKMNDLVRRKSALDQLEDNENEHELEVANKNTRKARKQTFYYRGIKQILEYFYTPIIMGVIVIAIGAGVKLFYNDILHSVEANFVNTQPIYLVNEQEYLPYEGSERKQPKEISQSDIRTPNYSEQYGTLSCKKLDIDAPVYFGDRGSLLKKGAGTYIGSFLPGQGRTILIGAHDTTYFEGLQNVKKGDKFTFTTEYGIYTYQVEDMEIADAKGYDKAYDLKQNEEQLVLYTCYPFGRLNGTKEERMFVYLDKVNGPNIAY